jgi:5-methylcytosine-specific restriction protein A
VTGRKIFTSVEIFDEKTQTAVVFKIYPESMEANLEVFLAFFRDFGNPTFSLPDKISFEGSIGNDFREAVELARKLTPAERKKMLDEALGIPEVKFRQVAYYVRNPYVVAQRLEMAAGRCEKCRQSAPFIRDGGRGAPYLEVYHKLQLSKGGLDTIENTEALCPNCHRERHYG